MRFHRDLISGGALLGLSILYCWGTLSLPPGRDEPGPAFFPVLLSLALGFIALLILVRGLRSRPSGGPRAELGGPLVTMALTALYAIAFEPVGFLLSTFLYTLFLTLAYDQKRWRVAVAVPFITTTFVYLLFDLGLGVRLPMGLLS